MIACAAVTNCQRRLAAKLKFEGIYKFFALCLQRGYSLFKILNYNDLVTRQKP